MQGIFEMARAETDDATLVSVAADVAKLEKEVGDPGSKVSENFTHCVFQNSPCLLSD